MHTFPGPDESFAKLPKDAFQTVDGVAGVFGTVKEDENRVHVSGQGRRLGGDAR